MVCFFFFKQKTAYEMRISDWSSDVCSSDLIPFDGADAPRPAEDEGAAGTPQGRQAAPAAGAHEALQGRKDQSARGLPADRPPDSDLLRSEEHTSELQSLMRISYAVFCLKKKNKPNTIKKDTKTHKSKKRSNTN